MGLDEYYEAQDFRKVQITGFDEELAEKAEKYSTKWVSLYRYSLDDDDIANTPKTSTSSTNAAALFSSMHQDRLWKNPEQEIIAEKNNIIFMHEKYFKFKTKKEQIDVVEEPVENQTTTNQTTLDKFSTIFGSSCSDLSCDEDIQTLTISDAPKSQPNTQVKSKVESKKKPKSKSSEIISKSKKNKNRRQKPINLSEFNAIENTAPPPTHSLDGAPPGVRNDTKGHRTNIDLSKNSNYSLQFRL